MQYDVEVPLNVTHHIQFKLEDEINVNIASCFSDAIRFIESCRHRDQKVI